ncbi:ParA family protein [Shimia sp. R9_3]|uniref:ParA family protein n=1 Tax=Shimia sp. R9_3 TaxID=2821113 RepID=UPI001ADC83F2|nr:ParA family protein [Shimia sp. R9_3]MBO9403343.1 ParA family protein [Shimia sp. R9_3]
MYIVATFSPKGGSGKTTAIMALAFGMITQGKRVAVMNCNEQAAVSLASRHSSDLKVWYDQFSAGLIRSTQLKLFECTSVENVQDAMAVARTEGFDVLLIDTSAILESPQLAAIEAADLVVAPAITTVEAMHIIRGIKNLDLDTTNFVGLVTGCRSGPQEIQEIRNAFGECEMFHSELPWASVFAHQILYGDLAQKTASLACSPGRPGYARFIDAQSAFVSALRLSFEIEWMLKGLRLDSLNQNPTVEFLGFEELSMTLTN